MHPKLDPATARRIAAIANVSRPLPKAAAPMTRIQRAYRQYMAFSDRRR